METSEVPFISHSVGSIGVVAKDDVGLSVPVKSLRDEGRIAA
jgi:hypothetical protein